MWVIGLVYRLGFFGLLAFDLSTWPGLGLVSIGLVSIGSGYWLGLLLILGVSFLAWSVGLAYLAWTVGLTCWLGLLALAYWLALLACLLAWTIDLAYWFDLLAWPIGLVYWFGLLAWPTINRLAWPGLDLAEWVQCACSGRSIFVAPSVSSPLIF